MGITKGMAHVKFRVSPNLKTVGGQGRNIVYACLLILLWMFLLDAAQDRIQAYVRKNTSVSKLLSPMRTTCGVPSRRSKCILVTHPNYCDRKIMIERKSCGAGAVMFWANFQFHLETPVNCACINSPQSATEGSRVLAVHVQTEWCKKLSLSSLSRCLSFFGLNHLCGRTNVGFKHWWFYFFLILLHPYFSPLWLCFGKVWPPWFVLRTEVLLKCVVKFEGLLTNTFETK